MDITLDNVDRVLDTSSPVRLMRVFFKLLDPTQDRNFVLKYTVMFLLYFLSPLMKTIAVRML